MEAGDKKLALFFTCGVSLKAWEKVGNLEREIILYNLLAKNFEKIYFITYGGKEDLKFKKVLAENIKILPKKCSFLPSKVYAFLIPFIYRKKLKEVDICKTNQMAAAVPALLTKFLYKKKLFIRCGYEWLKLMERERKPEWKLWFVSFLEKLVYKNADKIMLTSFGNREFLRERLKLLSLQIEVIPNYIDINLFKPMNIERQRNRICFVGRLSKEKNLFNLLKAVSNLNVKLVIFGSGPLRNNLENLAKKLNSQIKFKGNIPNRQLPEELSKNGLFILPSLYEGNPKVLLEAMACGLPCIGTNVEGIKEIIKHKENGYLCNIDAESIRKAILEVINNEDLKIKIGKNARKTILENFSLEKILEKEIKIYEEIL